MFTKNLDTNTRDHITEGSNKKEITVNMNDTINVVIRRRISNREESSESLRYKTSFSPIQNNMFINTKMQVDSVVDDNTQGSKKWSTTKTEKRNEDQPLSPDNDCCVDIVGNRSGNGTSSWIVVDREARRS